MATGLSHEMHRNRSGFLKPAASSTAASDVGMAAGAGFKRSNRLSVRKTKKQKQTLIVIIARSMFARIIHQPIDNE